MGRLQGAVLTEISMTKKRKPGLEPGPLIWLTSALAIELLPHEYVVENTLRRSDGMAYP